jgi:hypothetical protein
MTSGKCKLPYEKFTGAKLLPHMRRPAIVILRKELGRCGAAGRITLSVNKLRVEKALVRGLIYALFTNLIDSEFTQ